LLVAGCWGGPGVGSKLEAEQREHSSQTIETADYPLHGAQAGSGAEMEDEEAAGDEDTSPASLDPQPAEPAADPDAGEPPPHYGDDSARCGNGVLDADEICDVTIPEGEEGACPTECHGFDDCHPLKLRAQTCWSACVRDVPDPELCGG
jgi:hypothetical protein